MSKKTLPPPIPCAESLREFSPSSNYAFTWVTIHNIHIILLRSSSPIRARGARDQVLVSWKKLGNRVGGSWKGGQMIAIVWTEESVVSSFRGQTADVASRANPLKLGPGNPGMRPLGFRRFTTASAFHCNSDRSIGRSVDPLIGAFISQGVTRATLIDNFRDAQNQWHMT